MKSNKVYLENRLPVAIHVIARAEDGLLSFTIHAEPQPGSERIPPGKAAIYPVNDELRRCIRGGKLNYELRNRSGMTFVPPNRSERMKDGPIIAISPLPN